MLYPLSYGRRSSRTQATLQWYTRKYFPGKDAPVVWVAGNDARGVLFGVGRLLRSLRLRPGKVVLLNQYAPHHTHLRKIISRAFTPRAIESLRDELRDRAHNIAKEAAAVGSGDFVEQERPIVRDLETA